MIQESDRDHFAKRLLAICKEKGYRSETHLLSVSIFDRYLALNHKTLTVEDLPLLMTTSAILAAKLE